MGRGIVVKALKADAGVPSSRPGSGNWCKSAEMASQVGYSSHLLELFVLKRIVMCWKNSSR